LYYVYYLVPVYNNNTDRILISYSIMVDGLVWGICMHIKNGEMLEVYRREKEREPSLNFSFESFFSFINDQINRK